MPQERKFRIIEHLGVYCIQEEVDTIVFKEDRLIAFLFPKWFKRPDVILKTWKTLSYSGRTINMFTPPCSFKTLEKAQRHIKRLKPIIHDVNV